LGRIKVAVARAVQRDAPVFGQVQSDVAAIVEQSGAQQQRLQTARDLIAGRPTEEVAEAMPLREAAIDAATIRMQAARTAAQVGSLRDKLPRVLATNANVAKCQPVLRSTVR
jgi:predicted trehalose synthase